MGVMATPCIYCPTCCKWVPEDRLHPGYTAVHHCSAPTPVVPTHDDFHPRGYEFAIASGPILAELVKSCEVHPQYPRDPQRRAAIVLEEAGEAHKEAMDLTGLKPRGDRENLRHELIQTAAMCYKALIAMTREDVAVFGIKSGDAPK